MDEENISYSEVSTSYANQYSNIKKDVEELSDDEEEEPIKCINIMFLPFQFWWQTIILYLVCVKCFFGPLKGVLPFLNCSPEIYEGDVILKILRFTYLYLCDEVYTIDTFLYILHRQVADEAMRQEYLPKSAFLILIDVMSLIPFYGLFATTECKVENFWPNVLNFTDMLVIYRVAKYFSLKISHNYFKLLLGYVILFILVINATSCFLLLLTINGFCEKCARTVIYHRDWRAYKIHELIETKNYNLESYFYGCEIVSSLLTHYSIDSTKGRTFIEYGISITLMLLGYILLIFILMPKLFAENILRLKTIHAFHPRAKRIVEETKRRNSSPSAHRHVEEFYKLVWNKREGISSIPKAIYCLPMCIRVEIMQDLIWPVFYHSPTLRHTSRAFQSWIGRHIKIKYKLPGERFFSGPHCNTDMHYIKSGIVQFISNDDSAAPILSVTGGTIFGDISFYLPPVHRKVTVRCLTYCQVITIPRQLLLRAMHKFPEDRENIFKRVRERIHHAHGLHECKKEANVLDLATEEGIIWIKQRWWEINKIVRQWKKTSRKSTCRLPPEKENYHCAKYIGQLVLCDDKSLRQKTIFAKEKFPFIMIPYSTFILIWHRIIICTIYVVLFIYPPNLMRQSVEDVPVWFMYVKSVVDLIYVFDVIVTLTTAESSEERMETNLMVVIYECVKKKVIILDILSTVIFEKLLILVLGATYSGLTSYNVLIKTYILFWKRYRTTWNKNQDPLMFVLFRLFLSTFSYLYIVSYVMYVAFISTPLKNKVTIPNHYRYLCSDFFVKANLSNTTLCSLPNTNLGLLEVVVSWLVHLISNKYHLRKTLYDISIDYLIIFFLLVFFLYHKMKIISTLYLENAERINYQFFVSNLKRHYIRLKIHPKLLKRLDNYLNCHWKYYHGSDIIHPNLLRDEPYGVYWRLHGEIAENIIAQSRAFEGADPALIRELAFRSKYLILPKGSTLAAFGTQTDKVSWVFRGFLKSMFHNEKGEIWNAFAPRGNVLGMGCVFLNRVSLRTYMADSDVEILYLNIEEFNRIIKHFPDEASYLLKGKEEFTPIFDEMYKSYILKNRHYKQNMGVDRQPTSSLLMMEEKQEKGLSFRSRLVNFLKEFRNDPESRIFRYWMTFRVFVFLVSVTIRPSKHMCSRRGRQIIVVLNHFANSVTVMDIILKMFVPYYDERGLIICSIRKCAFHYITRGFLPDIIGFMFGHVRVIDIFITNQKTLRRILEIAFPYLHVYLLTGYLNYHTDKPSANTTFLMLLKWILIIIPIGTSAACTLFWLCVDSIPDGDYSKAKISDKCWVPNHFLIWERKPNFETMHLIIANAADAVLDNFLNQQTGRYLLFDFDYIAYMALFRAVLTVFFWFLACYFVTLFILKYRGDSMFEHGVGQLKTFLKRERINNKLIHRVMDYFSYWWKRTSGVNMKVLMNERIGSIFRQDINYYFFKKTLQATDTLLHGGDILKRKLAYYTSEQFFLAGEDITREMDLCPHLFIVHRGEVAILSGGEKVATLTKGSIFGQLTGKKIRPIRITAQAVRKADVLVILIKDFQEVINDYVRRAIANHPNSKFDYMNTKKPIRENPYNTIEYILRGDKAIRFPFTKKVLRAEKNVWYARWLFLVLFMNPLVCCFLTLVRATLPDKTRGIITNSVIVTDVLHFIHLIIDMFAMELAVIETPQISSCVYKYATLKKFKDWRFYCDLISIFVPSIFLFIRNAWYIQARLLRIHAVFLYHRYFCGSFKARKRSIIIKITMSVLVVHALVCCHILIGCNTFSGKNFPLRYVPMPENVLLTIDNSSWQEIHSAKEPVCHVSSVSYLVNVTSKGQKRMQSFLTPKYWQGNYIIALLFVTLALTSTNIDFVNPVTVEEIYYKFFVRVWSYFFTLWITSFVISSVYTSYCEMYEFDFQVTTLLKYLKINGVSKCLRTSALKYTKLLWLRTKGNWLPKITRNAPQCLCEDILSALYMHHLLTPTIFQNLPEYFLRQLVMKLSRIIIFPGKFVVQEGDINPSIYFIHEGEVEKWYTDKNGDQKLSAVLTTNGYFGLVPGLFPNTPYAFSYRTRTVVDFVYLENKAWQDLLDGYPAIKTEIYTSAKKMAKDVEAMATTASKHTLASMFSRSRSLKSM